MASLVRSKIVPAYGEGTTVNGGTNPRGEYLVATALPERTELVRNGYSFGAAIPTGSAFTYVAAWPTTRAELVLWNGEASGGKSYAIDRVWMYGVTSMAASQPLTLIGQIAPASLGVAAPTDNTAVLRHSLLGPSTSVPSLARCMLANTAFAVANQWFVLASATPSPTTNLGASVEKECYGRYLVTPGSAFCLAGIAGTAAGTAIIGLEWHEVQITY